MLNIYTIYICRYTIYIIYLCNKLFKTTLFKPHATIHRYTHTHTHNNNNDRLPFRFLSAQIPIEFDNDNDKQLSTFIILRVFCVAKQRRRIREEAAGGEEGG